MFNLFEQPRSSESDLDPLPRSVLPTSAARVEGPVFAHGEQAVDGHAAARKAASTIGKLMQPGPRTVPVGEDLPAGLHGETGDIVPDELRHALGAIGCGLAADSRHPLLRRPYNVGAIVVIGPDQGIRRSIHRQAPGHALDHGNASFSVSDEEDETARVRYRIEPAQHRRYTPAPQNLGDEDVGR